MSTYYGKKLTLTIFGASHAECVGIEIKGLPKGIKVDPERVTAFLSRRSPSSAVYSTKRRESDVPVYESGTDSGGYTDGNTFRAVIYNGDVRGGDYSRFADIPRPGHADYTARLRYGEKADIRGGGAFSGRMTAPLCIAGAIAESYLSERGVYFVPHIVNIGGIADTCSVGKEIRDIRFPVYDEDAEKAMLRAVERARGEGDSLGGIAEITAYCPPAGLGGELFDGIESEAAALAFAVPAVKGVEFGSGFSLACMKGSEANDRFILDGDRIATATNNCGGILGGITDGMPIVMRAVIKPTPSISKEQKTLNISTMTEDTLTVTGRHDACILPRALPALESCLAIALLDNLLL